LSIAQAAAEGILGHEATVEALARSALATPIVQLTRSAPHWRELFVAVELGDMVIEGYVDLLVRDPVRGLLVVDYKTDRLGDPSVREQRLRHYRIQLAAYGVALESVLGEPVAGGVVVLCHPERGAEEIEIDSWPEAMSTVRDRTTR
jgi:ATP-dependent exoDNAse (exonuclease V) beta subunit